MIVQTHRLPILLFGPSGSGKSSLGRHLATKGWIHLEADLFREERKDGIDEHGLRATWDAFIDQHQPFHLARELEQRRAKPNALGIVLTLPSLVVPPPNLIVASKGLLSIKILFGSLTHCLGAFLEREQKTTDGLGRGHWEQHNRLIFAKLIEPPFQAYIVQGFHPSGERRQLAEIADDTLR